MFDMLGEEITLREGRSQVEMRTTERTKEIVEGELGTPHVAFLFRQNSFRNNWYDSDLCS